MNAASLEYLMKSLFKLIGVSPESLNPIVLIPQLLASQGIEPEHAKQAFEKVQRLLIDTEQNQAHTNMRLIAILNHLGIEDPVSRETNEPLTIEENQNG